MKKILLIALITSIISGGLSFLILFEGELSQVKVWWAKWTVDSPTLPFSPYKKRRENSSLLEYQSANKIEIYDERLFWKGSGAVALPEITKSGKLVKVIIGNGGSGYSNSVKARVLGANSNKFELGNVKVINGAISSVGIVKSFEWSKEPLAFNKDEEYPFSGTAETVFPSGQKIEETNYLSGKIHGKSIRYDRTGIPIADKDFVNGKKHGTHIFWFPKPIDPSGYTPKRSSDGDLLPTLWTFLHSEAKEKFNDQYGGHESNQWVVSNFKLQGGSFQVRLLEHWNNNLKDGLFEGFDEFSNKTFKDEYKMGLRIKHKIFDKSVK